MMARLNLTLRARLLLLSALIAFSAGCARDGWTLGERAPRVVVHQHPSWTTELLPARGSVTVMAVWASWCSACQTTPGAMAALAASEPTWVVRTLSIDERDAFEAFLDGGSRGDEAWRGQLRWWGQRGYRATGVQSIPAYLVFDGERRWVGRHEGPLDGPSLQRWARAELDAGPAR